MGGKARVLAAVVKITSRLNGWWHLCRSFRTPKKPKFFCGEDPNDEKTA
jgi:hypothetical protein